MPLSTPPSTPGGIGLCVIRNSRASKKSPRYMSSIFLTDTLPPNRVRHAESGHDSQADPRHNKVKNWRVIHACEHVRDVLPVVEGQVAAGMQPYIVTPQGAGAAEMYIGKNDLEQPDALSLIRAWQDVRHWRKSLLECDPATNAA